MQHDSRIRRLIKLGTAMSGHTILFWGNWDKVCICCTAVRVNIDVSAAMLPTIVSICSLLKWYWYRNCLAWSNGYWAPMGPDTGKMSSWYWIRALDDMSVGRTSKDVSTNNRPDLVGQFIFDGTAFLEWKRGGLVRGGDINSEGSHCVVWHSLTHLAHWGILTWKCIRWTGSNWFSKTLCHEYWSNNTWDPFN